MNSSVEDVLFFAFGAMLDDLEPNALGIRSHAVSTEDHATEAAGALRRLNRIKGPLRAVIGRPSGPLGLSKPRDEGGSVVEVLDPHTAAARATTLRNDTSLAKGTKIIYLNTESSPGESGLDGLDELTPQRLALGFATASHLSVLGNLAKDKRRWVTNLLEDAPVDLLAAYEEHARASESEPEALPILGFIPDRLEQHRRINSLMNFTGQRLVNELDQALKVLTSSAGAERKRIAVRLKEKRYVAQDASDPVSATVRLCKALRKFAGGDFDVDMKELCGLNLNLVALLRRGEQLLVRLFDDEEADLPKESPKQSSSSTEEQLVADGFAEKLLAPIVENSEDFREIVLEGSGTTDRVRLRSTHQTSFVIGSIQGPLGAAVTEGCALVSESEESILMGRGGSCRVEYALSALDLDREPAGVRAAVEHFCIRRRELLSAAEKLEVEATRDTEEEEAISDFAGLAMLESFPLLVVRRLDAACEAYVEAYQQLVEAITTAGRVTSGMEDWLVHLDLAFSFVDGATRAARLLPAHPLRISRFRLWANTGNCPPRLPPSLGVNYKDQVRLWPHPQEHCYHRDVRSGPTATQRGVVACARSALAHIWDLLLQNRLAPSLDIEVQDVPNPGPIVEAILLRCQELFDDNAECGDWAHLRIWISYSDARERRGFDFHELRSQLHADLGEYFDCIPGDGLSVEVHETTGADVEFRHLVVQATRTPYRFLPTDDAGDAADTIEVDYFPSSAGTVGRVEVRGEPGTKAYDRLLAQLGFVGHRTREPGLESPSAGNALIRGLVCSGGWPVRPEPAAGLLSYAFEGDDVYVVLANPDIRKSVVDAALVEDLGVPRESLSTEREKIEAGILQLYPCRNFLKRLLNRPGDTRLLRSERSLLTALYAAKSHRYAKGAPTLVVSLDTPEAIAWARTVGAFSEGSQSRADLLILETDQDYSELQRVRVVELKTSEKAKSLKDRLAAFAAQPILAKQRIKRLFQRDAAEMAEVERFRRLVWFGAGHQQEALRWETPLRHLDTCLREKTPIELTAECWLVPDTDWDGESEFVHEIEGAEVFYRVLPPTLVDESPATETPSAPIGPSERPITARPPHVPKGDLERPKANPVQSGVETDAPPSTQGGGMKPLSTSSGAAPALPTGSGLRVELGHFVDGREALWLPNRTDLVNHFNIGITGTMGTGKTQLVKSLIAQLVWESDDNVGRARPPGILIFDYKGDYVGSAADSFPAQIQATVLRPENLPLNPLKLVAPKRSKDFAVAARAFADTLLSVAKGIGIVQRDAVVSAIQECFTAAGIDRSNEETWDRPFPTVTHLLNYLRENDLAKGLPQSLLGDLVDLEVFSAVDPDMLADDVFDGITVIDLTELASTPHVIRLVIAFFMNAFYDSMVKLGEAPTERRTIDGESVQLRQLRRILLVDEADDFMGLNLKSLKNTMQQGRSFGCGVVLSTQFLGHFQGSDAQLRQLVGTWLMHRMAEVKPKEVEGLAGTGVSAAREIARDLARMPKHHSFAVGLSTAARQVEPCEIHDLPFYQLNRTEDGTGVR